MEDYEYVVTVPRLYVDEMQTLIRWFLFYMPMEQRRKLMANLPQIYSLLFPDVSVETIVCVVQESLVNKRNAINL